MSSKTNVLEVYKGIKIRASNVIRLRINKKKYKELIDAVETTGLSIPKLIAISSNPCDKCKGILVSTYTIEGEEVKVKRGILSDYNTINTGQNILQQKNHKHVE